MVSSSARPSAPAAASTRRDIVSLAAEGTPETYLKSRGSPAFERVVDNLAEMVQTRRQMTAASLRLSIWMTGLRENLAELPDIIDPAAWLGVEEVYVSFRGADAQSPRASLRERSADRDPEPWRACSRPPRLAYVTAQGTALPCCIAPFTDAPFDSLRLGNYLEDGVAAVWHGPAYKRFREQLDSSERPASCRNCGLAWSL